METFTATILDKALMPSLIGLDLSGVRPSETCSDEQRAVIANLLDACAAAVCAWPEFFPPENGLIISCECVSEGGQPRAQLRVRSAIGELLPVWQERQEANRAFAAWASALSLSLSRKGFSPGHIYWPEGAFRLELVLIVPSLDGEPAIFELNLHRPSTDILARARTLLRRH